jgi:hypothetical protein
MDPRDPSERPSIFSAPDARDERHPGSAQPIDVRREPPRASRYERPVANRSDDLEPLRQSGPSRRLVIGLSVAGLLILVIGGFVAGSILGPADGAAAAATSPVGSASSTPVPSIGASPTAEPTATASPSPTPSPTPIPTPAGPPQEVAAGAWATVAVEELNVRSDAGTDAASNYLLVRGAVVHVAEGPVSVAGLNWYRIASLGGAVGWVSSGWVAEPFLTTLVEDPTLIRCGEVGRAVFDVLDGVPTPHDPITIGDLALPVAAFSDFSLGAIELMRAIGGEACFSAQVGSDGAPAISAQLNVAACGRLVHEGDFYRIRPAALQNVGPEGQVKDPAIVHPALYADGPQSDRFSPNLGNVFTLIASAMDANDATGCVFVGVTEGPDGTEAYRSVDTTQCLIVHEHTATSVQLSPIAAWDPVVIQLSENGTAPGTFPVGVPTPVGLGVSAGEQGGGTYVYQGYLTGCG